MNAQLLRCLVLSLGLIWSAGAYPQAVAFFFDQPITTYVEDYESWMEYKRDDYLTTSINDRVTEICGGNVQNTNWTFLGSSTKTFDLPDVAASQHNFTRRECITEGTELPGYQFLFSTGTGNKSCAGIVQHGYRDPADLICKSIDEVFILGKTGGEVDVSGVEQLLSDLGVVVAWGVAVVCFIFGFNTGRMR